MADSKISALPASTTPLAGTEVLPIVQSSATKQVSVANLTAGRAISATQLTLTTGNLIVANGQGVDFSATSGTGTSELLADYEEGTWTPVVTGSSTAGTATYAAATAGRYTKIGRQVFFEAHIDWSAGTGTGNFQIDGLPFTSSSATTYPAVTIGIFSNIALSALNIATSFLFPSSTSIVFYQYPTGGGAFTGVSYDASGELSLSGSYSI